MKFVVLITSCAYHLARNEQCRSTWLKQWGHLIDYKFVFGQGYTLKHDDEIVFPVDDSYQGLPAKIQASHKWTVEQGYDFSLKTDCDIFLHIPRLLDSGFENYPYSGNVFWPATRHPFALGAAYWLDRHASEILANAPLPPYPANGGDDVWVGRIMQEHNIPCHHESRYHVGDDPNWKTAISVHMTDLMLSMSEIQDRMTACE